MAESKTYLNVPFAQKDEAKALGAKWDAIKKKWYVPVDKDLGLFARWQAADLEAPTTQKSRASSPKTDASVQNGATGVFTYPADKNFVAYSGDEPPWD